MDLRRRACARRDVYACPKLPGKAGKDRSPLCGRRRSGYHRPSPLAKNERGDGTAGAGRESAERRWNRRLRSRREGGSRWLHPALHHQRERSECFAVQVVTLRPGKRLCSGLDRRVFRSRDGGRLEFEDWFGRRAHRTRQGQSRQTQHRHDQYRQHAEPRCRTFQVDVRNRGAGGSVQGNPRGGHRAERE